MSLLDQLQRGKRLTADYMYDLLYGIANGDLSTTNNNLPLWRGYDIQDHVVSGCIWSGDSYGSTRYASMTSGLVCIDGQIVAVDAVANRQFTASKEVYVDVDNTGTLYYTDNTIGTASPALAAGRIRLAIIVTGATTIANQYSINQGNIANNTAQVYLPSTSVSGWMSPGCSVIIDSSGNLIHPDNPVTSIVSAYTRNGNATTGSPGGSAVAWNGLNYLVFQAEANTNYELVIHEPALSGATGNDNIKFSYYLSASAGAYTTLLGETNYYKVSGNAGIDLAFPFNSGAYSGKTYLEIKFSNTGFTGTMTMNSDSSRGAIYTIKKVN